MAPPTLGVCLRQLRQRSNLTLRKLAGRADVTATFLSDIELGRRLPSDAVLARLARALRTPVASLQTLDERIVLRELKRLCADEPGLGCALRTMARQINDGDLSAQKATAAIALLVKS